MYQIRFYRTAKKQLDDIFYYIKYTCGEPEAASMQIENIIIKIKSLSELPYRFPIRRIGVYSNGYYRNCLSGSYMIIYSVNEIEKTVKIVSIKHVRSRG